MKAIMGFQEIIQRKEAMAVGVNNEVGEEDDVKKGQELLERGFSMHMHKGFFEIF